MKLNLHLYKFSFREISDYNLLYIVPLKSTSKPQQMVVPWAEMKQKSRITYSIRKTLRMSDICNIVAVFKFLFQERFNQSHLKFAWKSS